MIFQNIFIPLNLGYAFIIKVYKIQTEYLNNSNELEFILSIDGGLDMRLILFQNTELKQNHNFYLNF